MGVEARVVLYAEAEQEARVGAEAAFQRMIGLDAVLSDYRVDSELNRLCARAGQGPVRVGEDLFAVLETALDWSRRSAGAFDVTVRPLLELWRERLAAGELPADEELLRTRQLVDWAAVVLDREQRTVALERPGMRLDLGGIGKGYACDAALEQLCDRGIHRALIELGGDLAAGQPPPGQEGWRIRAGCGDSEREYLLSEAAVATSGDTERFTLLTGVKGMEGRRLSHILDPRTGWPLSDGPCVTVVAPTGVLADVLASAASVLGPIAGRRLVMAQKGARVEIEEPGMVSLFDGQTLDGWVTRGGRYDGNAVWSVEDGAITGRVGENNAGGLIYTERPYTCFEMEVESLIDHPFDSGIFLRMVPDLKGAQVTLDDRPGGEIGGIYSDGYLLHNKEGVLRYRQGEWNHFRVRLTGFDMRIQVWMNGEKLTDYQLPEGSNGYAACGLIGLQVHGGREDPRSHAARFKNIRIRELPVFADRQDQLLTLFNGENLDGFVVKDAEEAYRVRDGLLEFLNHPGGGHLETADEYRDFRLRLDFQISRMANSGVFLRAKRGAGDPAYSGCEVQILDDFNWETVTGTTLKEWQFTGSLYGSVAPARKALRPLGEWNTYEILYRGSRLAVALNGQALYDVDTFALQPMGSGKPFRERAREGFIGLQRHATPDADSEVVLRFKNIRLQSLEEE